MQPEPEAASLPKRQETCERILLKRTHMSWYAPALYKMTGGSFQEMLDAIRALPKEQRTFEDDWRTGKRWIITQAAQKTLETSGFTIEKEPDIQLLYKIENLKSEVYTGENGEHWYRYCLPATLKVRNKHGVMQEVHVLTVVLYDGPEPWEWTRKVEEAHAACLVLREGITNRWEEARKQERSIEAWTRAIDAIKPLADIDTFIWTGHDVPPQPGTTVSPFLLALPAPEQEVGA